MTSDPNSLLAQGTLPYMALEVLNPQAGFVHQPGHDLESLLNSMLTICHYTIGPGGMLRQPIQGDDRIKFNDWFTTGNRENLAFVKSGTLEAFRSLIKPRLPQYWQDFAPFLEKLIKATWNGYPYLEQPNAATHAEYRRILIEVLEMYAQIDKDMPSVYAFTPSAKRPHEELDSRVRPSKTRRGSKGVLRDATTHYLESYQESAPMQDVVHK